MPTTLPVSSATDIRVDALLSDAKWGTNHLTYSFPALSLFYEYGGDEPSESFGRFLSAQQVAARAALKLYASVSDLRFNEVTETLSQHADIRFARSDAPRTAWAYFPNTDASGGDIWVNNTSHIYDTPQKGNYAYLTIIHEIGHALGLKHPHEDWPTMPLNRDSMEYTVMSYRSYVGVSTEKGFVNEKWGFSQSLMMYDIAAIQHLYGANYATNSGNTKYTWTPTGSSLVNGVLQSDPGSNRIFQTVWDGGGNDTYDFTQYSTGLNVDLNPGAWTITAQAQRAKLAADGSKLAAGNIANALLYQGDLRSLIENALGGSGSDLIKGNAVANTLQGNSGNDQLYGSGGNDKLNGGAGNDKLYGQDGVDMLTGGSGADTFVFGSTAASSSLLSDTIKDFKRGSDHIDLRSIDANTTSEGNQAFTYIGEAGFSGKAGQLKFWHGVVAGDVDGDGVADLVLNVWSVTTLAKGDFYL